MRFHHESKQNWIVMNKDGKYWSNDMGWTTRDHATPMSPECKVQFRIPRGAKWLRLF